MPTRRQMLLASGGLTVTLAGCSSGDGDDTGTETATESGGMQVPTGDATLTLALSSGANSYVGDLDEFETLTVELERVVLVGSDGTDDATIQLYDSGLDLTTLPDDEKTYFEAESFPSGNYTEAEIYLSVQEATRNEGGDVTYDGESPVTIDLGISEEYLGIESERPQTLTLSVNPRLDDGSFGFAVGYSASSFG